MTEPSRRRALVIVDFVSYSFSHTKFNAAVLRALAGRYDSVHCELAHGRELQRLVRDVHGLRMRTRSAGWKVWREWHFLRVLLAYRRDPILILGATGLQAILVALLRRVGVVRHRDIYYIVHSELEGLGRTGAGIQKRLFRIAVEKFGLLQRVNAAVLGAHILESNELTREQIGRLSLVPHPPPPLDSCSQSSNDTVVTIRSVAIVGLIRSDTKDIARINRFAELAEARGIIVHALGRRHGEFTLAPCIDDRTDAGHYSEGELRQKLSGIDAILCVHQTNRYGLTASGGAFDWLAYGKIGLFLVHPCFRFLSETGAPVVIGDDEEDLLEMISTGPLICSPRDYEAFRTESQMRFVEALNRYVGSR